MSARERGEREVRMISHGAVDHVLHEEIERGHVVLADHVGTISQHKSVIRAVLYVVQLVGDLSAGGEVARVESPEVRIERAGLLNIKVACVPKAVDAVVGGELRLCVVEGGQVDPLLKNTKQRSERGLTDHRSERDLID